MDNNKNNNNVTELIVPNITPEFTPADIDDLEMKTKRGVRDLYAEIYNVHNAEQAFNLILGMAKSALKYLVDDGCDPLNTDCSILVKWDSHRRALAISEIVEDSVVEPIEVTLDEVESMLKSFFEDLYEDDPS